MPALIARAIPAIAILLVILGLNNVLQRTRKSPIKPTFASVLLVMIGILIAVIVVMATR